MFLVKQVDVVVNGIPSSCRSKNCTFHFDPTLTSVINSVSPLEGQGGIVMTIMGSGFSEDMTKVSVAIGSKECELQSASVNTITCLTPRHIAGSYEVVVTIKSSGRAFSPNHLCFRYRLTLNSISPPSGGIAGGHVVSIHGEGFPDFVNIPLDDFAALQDSFLPWYRYGLGAPVIDGPLNLCSGNRLHTHFINGLPVLPEALEQQLPFHTYSPADLLSGSYWDLHLDDLHVSVYLGGSPCIIVESVFDKLSCVPTISRIPSISNLPSVLDVNVTVFSERAMLERAYTVSLEHTPVVSLVDPPVGPVIGSELVISGSSPNSSFSPEDIFVTIGTARCKGVASSLINITCYAKPHHAGHELVLVSTPVGTAVDARYNVTDGTSLFLFPRFRYKLQVESVQPLQGSISGGTKVNITGGIFVEGETEVFVGSVSAEILSLEPDSLAFLTPTSTRTEMVSLRVREIGKVSLKTLSQLRYDFYSMCALFF